MTEFLKELWTFMKVRKKFWLLPIIFVLGLAEGLVHEALDLGLAGAEGAAAAVRVGLEVDHRALRFRFAADPFTAGTITTWPTDGNSARKRFHTRQASSDVHPKLPFEFARQAWGTRKMAWPFSAALVCRARYSAW